MILYVSGLSWLVISFGAALPYDDIPNFFGKVFASYALTVLMTEPVKVLLRFGSSLVYARARRAKRAKTVHPVALRSQMMVYKRVVSMKAVSIGKKKVSRKLGGVKKVESVSEGVSDSVALRIHSIAMKSFSSIARKKDSRKLRVKRMKSASEIDSSECVDLRVQQISVKKSRRTSIW